MAKVSSQPQTELNWCSQEDRDVREILRAWEAARRAKAAREMVLTARTLGERRFLQTDNGMGGYVGMNLNAESFHYWGQRLGYQCWDDKQFCREYLRDNPYARVKNHARRLMVTVPRVISNKRFSKSYGDGGRSATRPTGRSQTAATEDRQSQTAATEEVACAR
jgi:hypothetical protein